MTTIQRARQLYLDYHLNKLVLRNETKRELKARIQQLLGTAIKETPSVDLFKHLWMLELLVVTLLQRAAQTCDVTPVERGFQGLETYLLLLVHQPWKSELKEIKMYGGYYRTRIKAVIPECEQILERAGFLVVPEKNALVFRGPVDRNFLLLMAFDCLVSQAECKAINDNYLRVKHLAVSLEDIISNLLNHESATERSASSESGLYTRSSLNQPPTIPKREPITINEYFLADQQNRHEANLLSSKLDLEDRSSRYTGLYPPTAVPRLHSYVNSPVIIKRSSSSRVVPTPFTCMSTPTDEIIPDLPQGTVEDHMRESLKLINLKDSKAPPRSILAAQPAQLTATSDCLGHRTLGSTVLQSRFSPESLDEGIYEDASKSFSYASKQSSVGGYPVNAHQRLSKLLTDPYDTGHPDSIYSQSSSSGGLAQSYSLHNPPDIPNAESKPVLYKKMQLSRQNAVPFQLSARAPKTSDTPRDVNLIKTVSPSAAASKTPAAHIQLQHPYVLQSLSSPIHYVPLYGDRKGELLQREMMRVGKSNSMKTEHASPTPSLTSTTSRLVQSLDVTYWDCPSCRKLNTSQSLVCSACSTNYYDQGVE